MQDLHKVLGVATRGALKGESGAEKNALVKDKKGGSQ
jgi:hypothetical protein